MKAAAILLAICPLVSVGADSLVYSGTYTRSGSKGIYAYLFQSDTGKLRPLGLMMEMSDPSFLAVHPNHRFLYAVSEDANTVNAFAIEKKTGKLAFLNRTSSHGKGPCHLALDASGRWLAVANYESGSMALLPVGADGRLGEAVHVEQHAGSGANPERQEGPHAHAVVFSPDNRFLLLADLGLDRIFVYRFDAAKGSLAANDPPFAAVAAGSGVRHLAFHPNGKALYAINEMGSTVTVFRYDASSGGLAALQTVPTLPANYKGDSTTAEIAVNAGGTILYGSNRGHDSIALFSIDAEKLTLMPVDFAPTMGRTPRHFTLDPEGRFLLVENQDSSEIVVFRVHPNTGQLTPVGRPLKDAHMPVCLVFVE